MVNYKKGNVSPASSDVFFSIPRHNPSPAVYGIGFAHNYQYIIISPTNFPNQFALKLYLHLAIRKYTISKRNKRTVGANGAAQQA